MSTVRKYTRTKQMTEDEYKEYLEKRKEEKRLYASNYMRKRRAEDPEFKAKLSFKDKFHLCNLPFKAAYT